MADHFKTMHLSIIFVIIVTVVTLQNSKCYGQNQGPLKSVELQMLKSQQKFLITRLKACVAKGGRASFRLRRQSTADLDIEIGMVKTTITFLRRKVSLCINSLGGATIVSKVKPTQPTTGRFLYLTI